MEGRKEGRVEDGRGDRAEVRKGGREVERKAREEGRKDRIERWKGKREEGKRETGR